MRALLVDDEPLAREELRALLDETGAFHVVGECANAIEALQLVRAHAPEVLFLDVQMPAVSGFELLSMVDDELMPHVVFVTAHDDFAIQAFEESAVDYLLKPVSRERLAKTVEKLRRLPAAGGARPAFASGRIERIPCQGTRSIKLVPLGEVEYVKSSAAGVYVVSAAGELFTDLTLKVLEERAGLLRCHKQFLVNIERVDEITFGEHQLAVIRTRAGHEVPVSRRHLPALRERLGL
jgi:two-component system LytT family response regulator